MPLRCDDVSALDSVVRFVLILFLSSFQSDYHIALSVSCFQVWDDPPPQTHQAIPNERHEMLMGGRSAKSPAVQLEDGPITPIKSTASLDNGTELNERPR